MNIKIKIKESPLSYISMILAMFGAVAICGAYIFSNNYSGDGWEGVFTAFFVLWGGRLVALYLPVICLGFAIVGKLFKEVKSTKALVASLTVNPIAIYGLLYMFSKECTASTMLIAIAAYFLMMLMFMIDDFKW